jgi:hypothetical protein
MNTELIELQNLRPCNPGWVYVQSKPSLETAWNDCIEPTWLIWYLRKKSSIKKEDSVRIAIFAAKQVLQYCKNKPVAEKTIQAAENWLKNPTEENRLAVAYAAAVDAAADAAYAAADVAVDAAAAAAYDAAAAAYNAAAAAYNAAAAAYDAADAAAAAYDAAAAAAAGYNAAAAAYDAADAAAAADAADAAAAAYDAADAAAAGLQIKIAICNYIRSLISNPFIK